MTDEKFTLVETNRERANIARSARYVNRKGKGSVKIGVEYKTEKELQALNGEVKSYDLSKAMDYREFKDLPDDLKNEYFHALYEKHGASDRGISLFWGVSTNTVSFYRRQYGIPSPKKGRNVAREAVWTAFISVPKAFVEEKLEDMEYYPEHDNDDLPYEELIPEEKKEQTKKPRKPVKETWSGLFHMNIGIDGTAIEVADMLVKLFDKGQYRFEITVNRRPIDDNI